MREPPPSTRDQILDAATDLFARQGYKATTIAQVEQAAGLSPGSGGLYRHFPSKQSLLEASLERARYHRAVPGFEQERLLDLDRPEAALRAVAEFGLAACRADRSLYMLLLRPGDGLQPDGSITEIQQSFLTDGVERMTLWIDLFTKAGRFRAVDARATATNALAALSWYFLVSDILDLPAQDMGDDRFLDTWVDCWYSYLRADPGGPGPAAR